MHSYRIKVITELQEKSLLEINEFLENVKNSFENVIIISIEDLGSEKYPKHNYKEYRVKFYHDLYLKL
jgi:hypothetical protein